MNYSQKISERLWNMPDKGELESQREETFIDDIIQKTLLFHIPTPIRNRLSGNAYGVKNIELAGPGAYARTLPNELLVKIIKDPEQRSDFLNFCRCYDYNLFVCGMGKDNLLAQGEL